MVLVWAAIQVSSVAASEPYASAAQVTENPSCLGLLHQPQMIEVVVATEDEADVESESHDRRA